MRLRVCHAVKHFLENTTLHGFKYLWTPLRQDQVVWVLWCGICVCLGGALCVDLWGRFLEEPTMLILLDPRTGADPDTQLAAPAVALCPSPERFAQLFTKKLSTKASRNQIRPIIGVLRYGNKFRQEQINLLEEVLLRNNITLFEAIMSSADPCASFMSMCRWQEREVICEELFQKEMTRWGACCFASADKLLALSDNKLLQLNPRLDLLLQCPESDKAAPNCYEIFALYPGQDDVKPQKALKIMTGHWYSITVTFEAVMDSTKEEKVVEDQCQSRIGYSRKMCSIRCMERLCGCSWPLQAPMRDMLPPCTVREINCLKTTEKSCECPPACQKVNMATTKQASRITKHLLEHSFDPIFNDWSDTSLVLSLRISNSGSRMFKLINTETWWSLLSSLGGVFNMFLGVGAITVLEVVYFLARLLLSCRRHPPRLIRRPRPLTRPTKPIPVVSVRRRHTVF